MINKIQNRINSNRADSRSMSEILMIVGAVVVALAVTTLIAGIVGKKAEEMRIQVDGSTADVSEAFAKGKSSYKKK